MFKEFAKQHPKVVYWLKFAGRSLLYFAILFTLIYLYHYKNVSTGGFIYNEF